MVPNGSSGSTNPEADGRRLGGGAIASLTGAGLLLIFMVQNTESVRLDFLSGVSRGRCGSSPSPPPCSGRWCGSDSA